MLPGHILVPQRHVDQAPTPERRRKAAWRPAGSSVVTPQSGAPKLPVTAAFKSSSRSASSSSKKGRSARRVIVTPPSTSVRGDRQFEAFCLEEALARGSPPPSRFGSTAKRRAPRRVEIPRSHRAASPLSPSSTNPRKRQQRLHQKPTRVTSRGLGDDDDSERTRDESPPPPPPPLDDEEDYGKPIACTPPPPPSVSCPTLSSRTTSSVPSFDGDHTQRSLEDPVATQLADVVFSGDLAHTKHLGGLLRPQPRRRGLGGTHDEAVGPADRRLATHDEADPAELLLGGPDHEEDAA